MKLPVYCYGHPVLRKEAETIEAPFEGFKELVADMFDAMYESEGVGLAAPQIGKSIRLVVIDAATLFQSVRAGNSLLSTPGSRCSTAILCRVPRDVSAFRVFPKKCRVWSIYVSAGSMRIFSLMKRKFPDFSPVSCSMSATISTAKCLSTIFRESAGSSFAASSPTSSRAGFVSTIPCALLRVKNNRFGKL